MVCNVVTFRPRSALRDLGRVLGFPLPLVDRLAKSVDGWSAAAALAAVATLADERASLAPLGDPDPPGRGDRRLPPPPVYSCRAA